MKSFLLGFISGLLLFKTLSGQYYSMKNKYYVFKIKRKMKKCEHEFTQGPYNECDPGTGKWLWGYIEYCKKCRMIKR